MKPLVQHQQEIERNRRCWEHKPSLRRIYAEFYQRLTAWIDPSRPGRIVELGSGIGNLKSHLPQALCTDLFANPWLDLVCDGYEMPFRDGSVSHLVLFDVFHHLQAPRAFLVEARRVLSGQGRLLLFEPFISLASRPAFGWFHHEPIAWGQPIDLSEAAPKPRGYYAAQGNATRLFFRREHPELIEGWRLRHAEAFSAFAYLLSGGYSRPALYPAWAGSVLRRLDRVLSRWPRVFGARCLVVLEPQPNSG